MPIKYIGAIMVFLSCGAAGFKTAANYRQELRCLSEFVRSLDKMESELEYRLTPMPQLFSNLAGDSSGCLRSVFLFLAQELEEQMATDAMVCMDNALASVKDVPTPLKNALRALGATLGKYDLQGQMNEIAAVKSQCNAQLETMGEKLDTRLRGYKTLGLCIGAGLAILLL